MLPGGSRTICMISKCFQGWICTVFFFFSFFSDKVSCSECDSVGVDPGFVQVAWYDRPLVFVDV